MEQIPPIYFEKLDRKGKLFLLVNNGRLLAKRNSQAHNISLFGIFGFYAEVFFNPETDEIISVQLIQKKDMLNLYPLRIQ